MVQGTASTVGKSVIVAALCRILRQDGYRVAPFKSQNMALNSFVTPEGGEIGRAQAAQAEAAGIAPSVRMNPILLKPEGDTKSQVIVLGKATGKLSADKYYEQTPKLMKVVEESLDSLCQEFEVVVIEGAGSPAEVNLKEREIGNMRVARLKRSPVLLVGDIDRGGVFASLVGTLELLDEEERGLIKGFIINKFRGEIRLLLPGLEFLEKKTGKPVLGVVPWMKDVGVPQEDSVYLDERAVEVGQNGLKVVVVRLSHMSNYDDFDPLGEAGCELVYATRVGELAGADLIIVPGTKMTVADLKSMRSTGMASAVVEQALAGTPVAGICGGYQMLGVRINDPLKVESPEKVVSGLGLLDVETTFEREKRTTQVKARVAADGGALLGGMAGLEVRGYEIHMGRTGTGGRTAFQVFETPEGEVDYHDGAISENGLVFGTYFHGLFHNQEFTRGLLEALRRVRGKGGGGKTEKVMKQADPYDRLAEVVRKNMDMKRLYEIIWGKTA
jgi:adenosylcobyric acid synthase